MLIINAKEVFHWIVLVGVIICFIFILSMFIYNLLLPNIAFEINDDKLIIYKIKKQKIILLKDISKFRLCDNSSSFDGCLWKQHKKSTSFIVNSILSFLFCLSLIVFLLIMNIDYQGGDGTYSWLTIIFESMTPYLLFDSQNTFYNQFHSLILFVTTIIVVCYIIQLIVWWLKKQKSFSLSTLIFYEINFILCSSLFLIFDLDISSQYRIINHLSIYLLLPGLCFGLYHLIYSLIQTKKVESIK